MAYFNIRRFFNEKLSIPQIVCVLLIVIGIVGLKLLTRE